MFNSQFPILIRKEGDFWPEWMDPIWPKVPFLSDEN